MLVLAPVVSSSTCLIDKRGRIPALELRIIGRIAVVHLVLDGIIDDPLDLLIRQMNLLTRLLLRIGSAS
jgi:hypothetical protein